MHQHLPATPQVVKPEMGVITVPVGFSPGEPFQIQSGRHTFTITLPHHCKPGDRVAITLPAHVADVGVSVEVPTAERGVTNVERPRRRRSTSPRPSRSSAHPEAASLRGGPGGASRSNVSLLNDVLLRQGPALDDEPWARMLHGRMHPVTLSFYDEELDFKYREREFSQLFRSHLALWALISALLTSHIYHTLDRFSILVCALMYSCILLRVIIQAQPLTRWWLQCWQWSLRAMLSFGSIMGLLYGPRAQGLMVPIDDPHAYGDLRAYGMMVVGHLTIFIASSFAAWTDHAFTFSGRVSQLISFGGVMCYIGMPSPYLPLTVSVPTCTFGTCLGALLGHLMERESRKRFLQQMLLRDTVQVLKAEAMHSQGEEATGSSDEGGSAAND